MCGVVAIRSWDGPASRPAVERATAALAHRGPDGRRTWLSPSGRAALGHARLAINDPEGAQPLANEDGRFHLAANGEFYDFRTARASLERRGHRFRTRSDSEIALHLYEDLGPSCLDRLRGQFAFVVWDEQRGALFAARDRFGLKPLFYCRRPDALYLASEAKALFAAGVPKAWDSQAAFHALHACPDERRSLFADIRQLPPGHFLLATNAGVCVSRWWDLPATAKGTPSRSQGPAAQGPAARDRASRAPASPTPALRVRELLEESVRLRTDADVPVGCLLSGGLDSSAVLGVAAAGATTPVAAFTVGFENANYDESRGARQMAQAARAEHAVCTLSSADLADHFAAAVRHAETLQYNAHGVARFLLARSVRAAGYKAVLAGEGADEAFFGYEFLRAAARASSGPRLWNRLRLLPRLLRSPARRYPGLASVSPWLARIATVIGAGPSLFARLARGLAHLRAVCSPDFLAEFDRHDPYRTYYQRCDRAADLSKREPARQLLYLWLHSLFANYHLAADRLDMAHGVEVRLPFLDHRLFEYANQLPLPLLVDGPQEKLLLRRAARPYLPTAVRDRQKRPFWAPPAVAPGAPNASASANDPLHDFLQDVLRGADMASVPFFDQAAVVRFLDRLPKLPAADRPAADSLLFMMASAAVLQRGAQGWTRRRADAY